VDHVTTLHALLITHMNLFGAVLSTTAGCPPRRSSNTQTSLTPPYKSTNFAARAVPTLLCGLLNADSQTNNTPVASQFCSDPTLPSARSRRQTRRRSSCTRSYCPPRSCDGAVLTVPSWFAPVQLDASQEAAGIGALQSMEDAGAVR
jgi:hypothetical protein